MKKFLSMILMSMILILMLNVPVYALENTTDFAGGDGTTGNPYKIETWTHLDYIRQMAALNNTFNVNYKLMNDLTTVMSDYATYNSTAAGWNPIGGIVSPFTGNFDGAGHTISGLKIVRDNMNQIGLFGKIAFPAKISNVGLLSVDITGANYVGGLVGNSYGGDVHNSYVTGTVKSGNNLSADDPGYIGGFVGGNTKNDSGDGGTISNSYANVTVSAANKKRVGGFVGYNTGTISQSYAAGNVAGGSYGVGGLIGYNSGLIENTFALGDVTVSTTAGQANGVGGLVGYSNGSISKSYAIGLLTGPDLIPGGLIGINNNSSLKSFWDTDTSGTAIGIASGTNYFAFGKTTAEMKTKETFTATNITWDFASPGVWTIVDTDTEWSYPYFQWMKDTTGWTVNKAPGYDGSKPAAATGITAAVAAKNTPVNGKVDLTISTSATGETYKIYYRIVSTNPATAPKVGDTFSATGWIENTSGTSAFEISAVDDSYVEVVEVDSANKITKWGKAGPIKDGYTAPTDATPVASSSTADDKKSNSSTPEKPAAPSVKLQDANNAITGLDLATMEYSLDGGKTWTQAAGPDLTGDKSVMVRVKAKDGKPASDVTTLTFTTNPVKPAAPKVTADDVNNKIKGLDLATMEYSLDGGKTWTQAANPDLTGNKSVMIRAKAKDGVPSSDATTLTFTTNPVKPAAPSVTADDAKNIIIGLDIATMEYSLDGGKTWMQAASPDLTGDKTVTVRFKAKVGIPASDATTLTFTTNPVKPAAPSVTADDTNNTIIGLDLATMEYSLDGSATWTQAAGPDLTGNKTIMVRVKAKDGNPAGDATTLSFTTNASSSAPAALLLKADDTKNTIIGLDLDVMEYSLDGGKTWTQAADPDLTGNAIVKVRVKAMAGKPAGDATTLTFTTKPAARWLTAGITVVIIIGLAIIFFWFFIVGKRRKKKETDEN